MTEKIHWGSTKFWLASDLILYFMHWKKIASFFSWKSTFLNVLDNRNDREVLTNQKHKFSTDQLNIYYTKKARIDHDQNFLCQNYHSTRSARPRCAYAEKLPELKLFASKNTCRIKLNSQFMKWLSLLPDCHLNAFRIEIPAL